MQLLEEGTKRDRSTDKVGIVLVNLVFKQDFLWVNAAAATQLLWKFISSKDELTWGQQDLLFWGLLRKKKTDQKGKAYTILQPWRKNIGRRGVL